MRDSSSEGEKFVKKLCAIAEFVVTIVFADVCKAGIGAYVAPFESLLMYRQVSHILPGKSKNPSQCCFSVFEVLSDSPALRILHWNKAVGFLFFDCIDIF